MPLMQSAWAFGFDLSMVVIFLITNLLPVTITWRVMFALGLLPALLILYIRIHVPEPECNISAQEKPKDRFRRALFGIFSPSLWRITVLGGLLGFGAHGGYHAIMVWLPIYLKQERHFSMLNTSTYLTVIIIAFWCGCVTPSFLLDKVGRRFSMVFFAICCIIIIRCYLFLPLTDGQMLMLGFPLVFLLQVFRLH